MIITTRIETELGTMIAGATDDGLCLLEFSNRRALNTEYKELEKYLKTTICEGEHELNNLARIQLEEYFAGSRKEFSIPLVTPGTYFQQAVWKELITIAYGSTRSYIEQATALGKPEAIRAVASANGKNRISIIIPCHRVIGTDGSLTGYGGGLHRKKWLLDHEKKYSGKSVELSLF